MKNRVKIKAIDFQLDNAQRNRTDNFRDNSKIIVRRGNVFNFKVELSEVLYQWTLTIQCKTQKYKFSSEQGDINGWSAKSSTVDCTSIWRVSLPLDAQIGIHRFQLSLYVKNSKDDLLVDGKLYVIANPFEPRSTAYNDNLSFLKEYLHNTTGLVQASEIYLSSF